MNAASATVRSSSDRSRACAIASRNRLSGGADGRVWLPRGGLDLSSNATITESISALYKTADLDDALYVLGAALTTSVTARTQLKVETIDTYKTRLLFPATVHNDVAVVLAFVYKL